MRETVGHPRSIQNWKEHSPDRVPEREAGRRNTGQAFQKGNEGKWEDAE